MNKLSSYSVILLFLALVGCASAPARTPVHGSNVELRSEIEDIARVGRNIFDTTNDLRSRGWDVIPPYFATESKSDLTAMVRIGTVGTFRSTFRETTGINIGQGPSPYVIITARPNGTITEVE